VVRALGSLEQKADIMARTRGRVLWAKEKKLWRTEVWLQHFCPRGLRARIARNLLSAGRARLSRRAASFTPRRCGLASVEMPRNRLSKGNDLIEGAMI